MIVEINGRNIPRAYSEGIWAMHIYGRSEDSRNGPVISIPSPVILTIQKPQERVLFHPVRNANPFFHVMEFVWMMAGSNDANWLSQFNKRMMDYADDGVLRGAYGWRWVNPQNQLLPLIDLLQREPDTRQAVLSMWDVLYDGAHARTSDRPCNTHIYFRVVEDRLNMTVCNRSNDFFWGMLGANAVHMTMLHELIARAVEIPLGVYQVMTNNLHVYPEMPNFEKIFKQDYGGYDYYSEKLLAHTPLLKGVETYEDFVEDCVNLVSKSTEVFKTRWVENVAFPIYLAYINHFGYRNLHISAIASQDWKLACEQWVARRKTT